MGHPHVAQLAFLSDVFKESLERYDASAIAYLGSATGNGLEHVRPTRTHRLTAIDINSEYLEILRTRYQKKIPCLETVEADLNEIQGPARSYSLIFAGLLFEYLDPDPMLKRISRWLEDGGGRLLMIALRSDRRAPYDWVSGAEVIPDARNEAT